MNTKKSLIVLIIVFVLTVGFLVVYYVSSLGLPFSIKIENSNSGSDVEAVTGGEYAAANLDEAIAKAENNVVAGKQSEVDSALALAALYAKKGSVDSKEIAYEQKAIDTATKVIAKDPKNSVAYRIIGYANETMKNIDVARVNYDKAIELNPQDAQSYSNKGHTYETEGNVTAAKAWYEKAVTIINSPTVTTNTTTSASTAVCSAATDVVFVLDESGSIVLPSAGGTPQNWTKDLNFLRMFASKMSLGASSTGSRIGVVGFSSVGTNVWATTRVALSSPQASSLTAFQSALNWSPSTGHTAIGYGINQGLAMFNSSGRANVKRVMIVITDGDQNVGDGVYDVDTQADAARAANITVMAIPVGSQLTQSTINKIAPSSALQFKVSNWSELAGKLQSVVSASCPTALDSSTTSTSTTTIVRQCTPGLDCPDTDLGKIILKAGLGSSIANTADNACPFYWTIGREDESRKIECQVITNGKVIMLPKAQPDVVNNQSLPVGLSTFICSRGNSNSTTTESLTFSCSANPNVKEI